MLARLSTRELYPQPLVLFFWDKISWSYSSWPRIHLTQTLNPWACLSLPSSWDYRTALSGLSPVFKIFLWCWELNMPCKCSITELYGLFLFQHLFCVCVNMHVSWRECTVESGQPMWILGIKLCSGMAEGSLNCFPPSYPWVNYIYKLTLPVS